MSDYEFIGWSADKDNNTPDENVLKNVTADRTVYACWQNKIVDSETREILISWDEVADLVDNGTYKDVLSVHDWKYADFGDEGLIPMEIAGFELDEMPVDESYYSSPLVNPDIYTDRNNIRIAWDEPEDENYVGTMIFVKQSNNYEFTDLTTDSIYTIVYKGECFSEDLPDYRYIVIGVPKNSAYTVVLIPFSEYGFNKNHIYKKVVISGMVPIDGPFVEEKVDPPVFKAPKAPITWIGKNVLNSTHEWDSVDEYSGGYFNSEIKRYLEEDIFSLIKNNNNDLKNIITPTNKITYSNRKINSEIYQNLWLLSMFEIFGASKNYEQDGVRYSDIFSSEENRQKTKVNGDEAYWWTRTSYEIMGEGRAEGILTHGDNNPQYSTFAGSILPCFCTGGQSKTHTVRFFDRDNVLVETQYVKDGETTDFSGDPTQWGSPMSFFQGWDFKPTEYCNGSVDIEQLSSYPITSDLDLYAHFCTGHRSDERDDIL